MYGAPIDPLQLLKALGPLLSPEGGIKSEDEVPRLSCLMKKFSRKLVSRCVYCNVLKATQADVLTAFLDESGWNTINKWLLDARTIENNVFLLEMLRLCQILPMTVGRLKENNTAKLIKALTKNEDQDVKTLALDVVNAWMSLIKGERSEILSADKLKKKKRKEREEKEIKEIKAKENKEKSIKIERTKKERESLDEDVNRYEDVVIKMPVEEPVNKKPKVDRPKTVKMYQAKFRSIGLEEDTPLPKDVTKKTATINRSEAVAAAKNAVKRMNTSKQIPFTGKKIKPANLINPDNNHNTGLIKLIPPKPKPIHILQESGSFIDALVAAPTQPLRRKKKAQTGKAPTTPPSPTSTPPKLQFYKDTLEMTTEVAEEKEKEPETKVENSEDVEEKSEPMDTNENKSESVANDEVTEPLDAKEIDKESSNQSTSDSSVHRKSVDGQLCSILAHGKRREKKKTVRWAEEADLKQVYYFEMDETERVNVNHVHNFGDLKSLEIKRERKAFENARRLMGDKMEESIPWMDLIPIDLPAPPIERGFNSKEKEIQMVHQQSTLQDIYFSREMLPETPHEPEQESITPQEPKTIPLEDVDVLLQDSNPGSIMDFSTLDLPPPKTEIPSVLSNLMMAIANPDNRSQPPPEMILDHVLPTAVYPNHHPNIPVAGGGNVSSSSGLLGTAPPGYEPIVENHYPNESETSAAEWDSKTVPPDQYSEQFYHMHSGVPAPNIRIPPPPRGVRPRMMHPPPICGPMPDMPRARGPRPMGPPRRKQLHVLCRNFRAGTCKFGKNCNFLHPGLNGPPL